MKALRTGGAVVLAAAAALGLSGCFGGDDNAAVDPSADPRIQQPIADVAPQVTPIQPGEVLRPGTSTPAGVIRALNQRKVVVIAFTMPGVADDDAVAAALRAVRADGPSGVAYFTYTLGQSRRFGDLPDLLDVSISPTVAVIGRDGVLKNLFEGLIDEDILRQSVTDAKRTRPAPISAQPGSDQVSNAAPTSDDRPTGNPAGIALARKTLRFYRNAAGISADMRFVEDGQTMTGTVRFAIENNTRTAMVADLEIAGAGPSQLVSTPAGAYARFGAATCWVRSGDGVNAEDGDMLDMSGHYSAPRRQGAVSIVRVIDDGETTVRRVVTRTGRILSVNDEDGSERLTDLEVLDAAPTIPSPEPLC